MVAALLLSAVLGYATYLNELSQFDERIADQSQLGLELLKLETRHFLETNEADKSNLPVQQVLDNLAASVPHTSLGRFSILLFHNDQRQEIARYIAPDMPKAQQLLQALMKQGLRYSSHGIEFADSLDVLDTPDIPVAAAVLDKQGKTIAYVNGVFVLSDAAVTEMRLKTLRAVLLTIVVILITIALVYPFIRGLTAKLSRLAVQMLDANVDTVRTLGSAIAKRDSDTDAHNYRVTVYAVKVAEALSLDAKAIRSLMKGAFLHDVGKIGIRDNILLKPGKLDEAEFSVMQQHVMHGLDIVHRAIWLEDAAEVVGNHHEKYDGTGYPQGLSGQAIPISARIFAIVDVFDALTSQRPYKIPFSLAESLAILHQSAGSHFDPELVSQFERLAPELYERFANDDESARSELIKISINYFQGDLGEILNDQNTRS